MFLCVGPVPVSGFFWAKSAYDGIWALSLMRIPKCQDMSLLFSDLSSCVVAHSDPSASIEVQQLDPGPVHT